MPKAAKSAYSDNKEAEGHDAINTPDTTRLQVRRVLIITLILNLIVAAGKIILGVATGALAITADGFHSLTDGAGNVAGLVANFIADQPPDDDHPYGHRRFETMAALFIGALLSLTAWEILQSAIARLRTAEIPTITPLTLVVLLATLAINIVVSRYQTRAGTRLNSEILIADAKNTRADVLVTISVLFSILAVAVTGWAWLDVVAALVVVVLIGKAAWDIVRETGRVLVDTAPYSPEALTALVVNVPDVRAIVRARSRGTLDAAHIDLDVSVPPHMTADQTNSIAYTIRQKLRAELTGLDEIDVQFVPYLPHGRDAVLTARAYADARGLSTHEVQVSGDMLEMHVEVPPQQTLAEAHEQVSLLEADVIAALPEIERIVTHIEPRQPECDPTLTRERIAKADHIQGQVQLLLDMHYPQMDWHDVAVRPLTHGYATNLHVILAPTLSVEDAHLMAEEAETTLRAQLPDLQRVTIHTEPYDHS